VRGSVQVLEELVKEPGQVLEELVQEPGQVLEELVQEPGQVLEEEKLKPHIDVERPCAAAGARFDVVGVLLVKLAVASTFKTQS
jgi:hypothetical protein